MAAPGDTNRADRDDLLEWEGGDPPCWAHLFEDDLFAAPIEAASASGAAPPERHPPAPPERGADGTPDGDG